MEKKHVPRCDKCLYWSRAKSTVTTRAPSNGHCRRSQPVIVNTNNRPHTMWPATMEDDWCGEYQSATYPITLTKRSEAP